MVCAAIASQEFRDSIKIVYDKRESLRRRYGIATLPLMYENKICN